ncbi:MAG: hypothetical protein DRQ46_00150 [Gammaproteobacteria bacterium]|nr:MAG: hypothetical protein DRQ46_00150 [Gammaproteobacteria bacterium]
MGDEHLIMAINNLTKAVCEFAELYRSVHTVPEDDPDAPSCLICNDTGIYMAKIGETNYQKKCHNCNK